ncbi:MAG TPA: hypothetical protein VJA47_02355 [archaeon]|nr:hypothetical protein [archaeon]
MKEAEAEFFRKVWSEQKPRYGHFQNGPYSGIVYKVADGVRRYVVAISRETVNNNEALIGLHDCLDRRTEEMASRVVARSNIRNLRGKEQIRNPQKALELDRILETVGIERLIIETAEYIVKSRVAQKGAGRVPA